MDEFNTPLGLDKDKGNTRFNRSAGMVIGSLTILLTGAGAIWFYLSNQPLVPDARQTEAAAKFNPAAVETKLSPAPLRETTQSPTRTFTESNPARPGRLDELAPDGQLEEPRITFLNSSSSSGPDKLSTSPQSLLLENSSFGPLPRISRSGKRPMDAYARPATAAGTVRIAIIVGGLGLSQSGSKSAIELLPADVTLAFAPYGNSLNRWMQKARQNGHELLMQVPMEPNGYPQINPGRNTLVSTFTVEKNIQNLHWSMGRMTNYVGMMNYLGARMNMNPEALRGPLAEIAKRGLLYVDDGSAFSSKAGDVAKELSLPFAQGSIVLDDGRSARLIDKNLQALEKLARRNGRAIGIASAFPVSVRQIVQWIKRAKKRGVEIVPISALVR